MLVLVSITHTAEPDALAQHMDAHRAYLRSLYAQGKIVASGPTSSRTSGLVILRVESEAEATEIVKRDPLRVHGVARHDVGVWTPSLGAGPLESSRKLEGRVALVTGASSGIGEATAMALAREGAKVGLAARRIERLQGLADRMANEGAEGAPLRADVAQEKDARALVDQVNARFGRLDIVVNSAGVMLLAPIAEATADEWRRMIDLNLLGLMHVTQAALPGMKRDGGGHIVNIASLAGRIANPGASAYAATKFGVVGFSEAVRREVYKHKIRVTVIEPGIVATELGEHIGNEKAKEGLKDRLTQIEALHADDIAAAVAYAVTQPSRVNVNEIVVRPTDQER